MDIYVSEMDIQNLLIPVISPTGSIERIQLSDLKTQLEISQSNLYYRTNICEGAGDITLLCGGAASATVETLNVDTYYINFSIINTVSSRCQDFLDVGPFRQNGAVTVINNYRTPISVIISPQEVEYILQPGSAYTVAVRFLLPAGTKGESSIKFDYSSERLRIDAI